MRSAERLTISIEFVFGSGRAGVRLCREVVVSRPVLIHQFIHISVLIEFIRDSNIKSQFTIASIDNNHILFLHPYASLVLYNFVFT